MDSSGGEASKRSALQGPRPTPLKVRKDSRKIKKPPVAPPPSQANAPPQPQQHRPPVIIYTLSPKVVHTTPGEFMSVVQRLTGVAAAAAATSDGLPSRVDPSTGQVFSPAARLAVFEKSRAPAVGKVDDVVARPDGSWGGMAVGILSPVPSSLPQVPANYFSSSDVSPAATSRRFMEVMSNFSPSTPDDYSNFFGSSGVAASPAAAAYWDLFKQLHD